MHHLQTNSRCCKAAPHREHTATEGRVVQTYTESEVWSEKSKVTNNLHRIWSRAGTGSVTRELSVIVGGNSEWVGLSWLVLLKEQFLCSFVTLFICCHFIMFVDALFHVDANVAADKRLHLICIFLSSQISVYFFYDPKNINPASSMLLYGGSWSPSAIVRWWIRLWGQRPIFWGFWCRQQILGPRVSLLFPLHNNSPPSFFYHTSQTQNTNGNTFVGS